MDVIPKVPLRQSLRDDVRLFGRYAEEVSALAWIYRRAADVRKGTADVSVSLSHQMTQLLESSGFVPTPRR